MNASMTHPAPAVRLISEVPGKDRLLGRSQAESADVMIFMAWYAQAPFKRSRTTWTRSTAN